MENAIMNKKEGKNMEIKVGVSNHHFHLTEEDYQVLYGTAPVEYKKALSQKGQYASFVTATIQTEKAKIENVRLLVPFRSYTQVELSKTDAYKLGIDPPIRDSGDLRGASVVEIIGSKGSIKKECAIIASRHIHLTKEDQIRLGLEGKREVQVEFQGEKGAVLHHVHLKVANSYSLELHLDTDDANALFLKTGDRGEII